MNHSESAWRWLIENLSTVEQMARRYARWRPEVAEELLGRAVAKVARLAETFRSERAPLGRYLCYSLSQWMSKWAAALWRERSRQTPLAFVPVDQRYIRAVETIDARNAWGVIEARLTNEENTLLRLRIVEGMSFQQAAIALGSSKTATLKRYHLAMVKARAIARRLDL